MCASKRKGRKDNESGQLIHPLLALYLGDTREARQDDLPGATLGKSAMHLVLNEFVKLWNVCQLRTATHKRRRLEFQRKLGRDSERERWCVRAGNGRGNNELQ
jgi:hypothetical protein